MLNKDTFNYTQAQDCFIETEIAPVEEFETVDIENLPQNTIVQWPTKPLPRNQAIVTKPCSVVLHKLKLIRINKEFGSIPGKVVEKSREDIDSDPDYVPEAEVRGKSSENETHKDGVTCGKFKKILFF